MGAGSRAKYITKCGCIYIIIIIIIIIYKTESTVQEGFEIFSFIQRKYLSDELRE